MRQQTNGVILGRYSLPQGLKDNKSNSLTAFQASGIAWTCVGARGDLGGGGGEMKRHQNGGAAACHTARQQTYFCKHQVHRPLRLAQVHAWLSFHPVFCSHFKRMQLSFLSHAQQPV